MFTVGPVAESWLRRPRASGSDRALVVDPGDEADRILRRNRRARRQRRRNPHNPLSTSTTSARGAPVAAGTGAPVYCPRSRSRCSRTSCRSSRGPASVPYESYDADEKVSGGEPLSLAGLEIDVLFTPLRAQPGPRDLRRFTDQDALLFSGDVLFKGSVRTPPTSSGRDGPTLSRARRPGSTRLAPPSPRPPRAPGIDVAPGRGSPRRIAWRSPRFPVAR